MKKVKADRKNVQFVLNSEEHMFITTLAAANFMSVADIFRCYVAYLMRGGKLLGVDEPKIVLWDEKTGEIRIKARDDE